MGAVVYVADSYQEDKSVLVSSIYLNNDIGNCVLLSRMSCMVECQCIPLGQDVSDYQYKNLLIQQDAV